MGSYYGSFGLFQWIDFCIIFFIPYAHTAKQQHKLIHVLQLYKCSSTTKLFMNWHFLKPNEFQNKLCFPFHCETHIQQGINSGLNRKQCCQSLLALTFKLGGVALACEKTYPAPAAEILSSIFPPFVHASYHDPTSWDFCKETATCMFL